MALRILDGDGRVQPYEHARFAAWVVRQWDLHPQLAASLVRQTEREIHADALDLVLEGSHLVTVATDLVLRAGRARSDKTGTASTYGPELISKSFDFLKELAPLLQAQAWVEEAPGRWKRENAEAWVFRDVSAPEVDAQAETLEACATPEGGRGVQVSVRVRASDRAGLIREGVARVEVCWLAPYEGGVAARCAGYTLTAEERARTRAGATFETSLVVCVGCEVLPEAKTLVFNATATDVAGNARRMTIPVVVPTATKNACCP
jgi:hypothetical protein